MPSTVGNAHRLVVVVVEEGEVGMQQKRSTDLEAERVHYPISVHTTASNPVARVSCEEVAAASCKVAKSGRDL